MAAKKFTSEEKEILRQNPYVESVENTRVIYTEEFKVYYMKNYLAGKKPTEIFVSAGFDPAIMGNKRIERASARLRKLYNDGLLALDGAPAQDAAEEKAAEAAPSTEESAQAEQVQQPEAEEKEAEKEVKEVKAPKKRRGRPKKKAAEPAKEESSEEKAEAPKKRRGRPRKKAVEEKAADKAVKEEAAPKKPRKKRVNKIALMAQNIKKAEEKAKEEQVKAEAAAPVKDEQPAPAEAPKKRRGRPRKNVQAEKPAKKQAEAAPALAAEVKEEQPVQAAPKKRRGRPRKNVQAKQQTVEAPVKAITAAPAADSAVIKQLVTALNDLMEEVHLLRGELALANKK